MALDPSPEYVAVARSYARAAAAEQAKRAELLPLLFEEIRRGANISALAREAGYTPQHVSRLARKAGIEPRVEREAPRHKPKKDDPDEG